MELEVSAWTRRERLERIAAAERDRRAGRTDLALATLGEGGEWPARIVLALARLPEDQGADAREILEATLDDWAAENDLPTLDADASEVGAAEAGVAIEAEEAPLVDESFEPDEIIGVDDAAEPEEAALVVDAVEALDEDLLAPPDEALMATPVAPVAAEVLEGPIEHDELERAFAEAEAQTDEMHGVNDVAERVLMNEPLGLAELSGEGYDGIDDDLGEVDPDSSPLDDGIAASETDAAWAEAPIWPESIAPDAPMIPIAASPAEESDAEGTPPSRTQVIQTLERWLDNIRAGRAQ